MKKVSQDTVDYENRRRKIKKQRTFLYERKIERHAASVDKMKKENVQQKQREREAKRIVIVHVKK